MDEKKIITVPGILTRISYSKDGGLSLGFSTQELNAEEKMALADMYQQFGHLAFSPNQIGLGDMPSEQAEDKSKTPSKRLRASLFVLFTQQGGKAKDFEPFYVDMMERIITRVKNKLD